MRTARFFLALLAALFFSLSAAQAQNPAPATPLSVAGADTPDGKRIIAKLHSIVIDKLNLDHMDLRDVFPYLTNLSREIDPTHAGVNLILQDLFPPSLYPTESSRQVNLTLTKISLFDVMQIITSKTGCTLKFENNAIVVVPKKS